MTYWMFTATHKKGPDGDALQPDGILKQRLEDKFWGLGDRTPNRRYLKQGDRVVFYVGLPFMIFAATARLASDSFALSDAQIEQYSHGKSIFHAPYGVMLEDIQLWDNPHATKDLVPHLRFIENKENWFAYFQGGVRQLPEEDYLTIIENRSAVAVPVGVLDDSLASESQFALENHLEEFIDKNWKQIDFGAQLVRYESDEQNGRQYPAGSWSIDFLCVDQQSGDLVVVELKRGKSSDATVGQVLRYISWVAENIASPGQSVRGIIIAHDVDDALRYAVKAIGNVSILTYRVDFKLLRFSP